MPVTALPLLPSRACARFCTGLFRVAILSSQACSSYLTSQPAAGPPPPTPPFEDAAWLLQQLDCKRLNNDDMRLHGQLLEACNPYTSSAAAGPTRKLAGCLWVVCCFSYAACCTGITTPCGQSPTSQPSSSKFWAM